MRIHFTGTDGSYLNFHFLKKLPFLQELTGIYGNSHFFVEIVYFTGIDGSYVKSHFLNKLPFLQELTGIYGNSHLLKKFSILQELAVVT